MFSIPLNYGLSREDAADTAQLTFTNLIQTLDTLTEIERLRPWFATAAPLGLASAGSRRGDQSRSILATPARTSRAQ